MMMNIYKFRQNSKAINYYIALMSGILSEIVAI